MTLPEFLPPEEKQSTEDDEENNYTHDGDGQSYKKGEQILNTILPGVVVPLKRFCCDSSLEKTMWMADCFDL